MKREILACIVLGLIASPSASWAQSAGGHAGDPVALDFDLNAQLALNALEADATMSKGISNFTEIRAKYEAARLFVVEQPVSVVQDEITQKPAAVNFTAPDAIQIYREGWGQIEEVITIFKKSSFSRTSRRTRSDSMPCRPPTKWILWSRVESCSRKIPSSAMWASPL